MHRDESAILQQFEFVSAEADTQASSGRDSHEIGRRGAAERHSRDGDDVLAALRETLSNGRFAGNHRHFIHVGDAVDPY